MAAETHDPPGGATADLLADFAKRLRSDRLENVGPYRILEEIGEGGMGVVFKAEQREPVRRIVALKFIKVGMHTRESVARFEAERQAMAVMDHPSVARVFDGGVTEDGRPYLVMEFVSGEPITKYCDRYRLSLRERLELFVQVCEAVHHAHQKGPIHRDLKPSNILVCEIDGKPLPKVIDFGIAKAVGQQLTEKTLFTGFGGIVGTPEYMSPEQAELNQLDIDTRSEFAGYFALRVVDRHDAADAQAIERGGTVGSVADHP